LNLRPSGYEPDELPDCSTPQQGGAVYLNRHPIIKKHRSAKALSVKAVVLSDRGTDLPRTGHAGRKGHEIPLAQRHRRTACRGHKHLTLQDVAGFPLVVGPGKARLLLFPHRPVVHAHHLEFGGARVVLNPDIGHLVLPQRSCPTPGILSATPRSRNPPRANRSDEPRSTGTVRAWTNGCDGEPAKTYY
jgi:hypothetical protein